MIRKEGRLETSMIVGALLLATAPSGAIAVDEVGQPHPVTSPRTTETPATHEARSQVEARRSITDPQKYLAYARSLAGYPAARSYSNKQ